MLSGHVDDYATDQYKAAKTTHAVLLVRQGHPGMRSNAAISGGHQLATLSREQ
jgi:hypothetical protein